MKAKIISVLFLCLFHNGADGFSDLSAGLPEPFIVIPQPKNVVLLKGEGIGFQSLKGVFLAGVFERPVTGNYISQLPVSEKPGRNILTLRLEKSSLVPESKEGYVLTIRGGAAEIVSSGEAGLFYGCQTLEQLLEDALQFEKNIPACIITDYPSINYRAVHFDVKHHLDHMSYYYRSIDRLARYKINAVVFEFEDKLRFRRQPLVGAPQSISIDEMAALTLYARERHIEICPLVQGLGHATFILKHQQYSYLREIAWNRWAFCPLHEGTYQVLFDLYRDAIDATPGSKYLHIGGDEIGNIGVCPRCKPEADRNGELALNLYWLKRVCEFAEENGRIPIFWDDMPLKSAGVHSTTNNINYTEEQTEKLWVTGRKKLDSLLTDFPVNCVYMRWEYSLARQPGNIKALDWYKSRGLRVMGATAAHTSGTILVPYDQRDMGMSSRGLAAIQSFMNLASEKKIDGMLSTAWDDTSPHMEMFWRGYIASAEYSWSPQGRSLGEYDIAWLQREFGVSHNDFYRIYNMLFNDTRYWQKAYFRKSSSTDRINFLQPMVELGHWLPPVAGEENKTIDPKSLLILLPDKNNPGSWTSLYSDRLKEAETIINNHKIIKTEIDKLKLASLRNRYHWRLYEAINDFTVCAPRILLTLKQYDTGSGSNRPVSIELVYNALSEFDNAWENLMEVYSETRFISNPPGYVPDRYFHYASQKEDLSWMIQAEEVFLPMIRKWIAD